MIAEPLKTRNDAGVHPKILPKRLLAWLLLPCALAGGTLNFLLYINAPRPAALLTWLPVHHCHFACFRSEIVVPAVPDPCCLFQLPRLLCDFTSTAAITRLGNFLDNASLAVTLPALPWRARFRLFRSWHDVGRPLYGAYILDNKFVGREIVVRTYGRSQQPSQSQANCGSLHMHHPFLSSDVVSLDSLT